MTAKIVFFSISFAVLAGCVNYPGNLLSPVDPNSLAMVAHKKPKIAFDISVKQSLSTIPYKAAPHLKKHYVNVIKAATENTGVFEDYSFAEGGKDIDYKIRIDVYTAEDTDAMRSTLCFLFLPTLGLLPAYSRVIEIFIVKIYNRKGELIKRYYLRDESFQTVGWTPAILVLIMKSGGNDSTNVEMNMVYTLYKRMIQDGLLKVAEKQHSH